MHSRPPGRGQSLIAVARAIGGSGLFCGCSPIRILPQPNGDVDICILVSCSDDSATTAYRCEYYCGTLEAEPTVASRRARGASERPAKGHRGTFRRGGRLGGSDEIRRRQLVLGLGSGVSNAMLGRYERWARENGHWTEEWRS